MRTPKEFRAKLDAGIITATMLSAALHSVNKRAKNYRDRERENRKNRDWYGYYLKNAESNQKKKMDFYAKKEKLLSVLSPLCVHQEYAGYERERIYDYEINYEREFFSAWINGLIVWQNSYWDYDLDCEVFFFDRILPDSPKYRYYLYYCVGDQTFHTPINSPKQYPDLPIKTIGTLDTMGEQAIELMSVQFVDKILALIESGNYRYEEDVPAIPPEYPEETEIEFEPDKPNWAGVWYHISHDLANLCENRLASEFSSTLKTSFCFKKSVFHLNQKKKHSRGGKSGKKETHTVCQKPRIKVKKVKLNNAPCMTPELETYLNALDTSDISSEEYAQYLTEAESPVHDYLLEVVKENLKRENTKDCLCAIAEQLYNEEPRKIELDEVWTLFLERYGNSEKSIL